jgi:pimeloyl-ACP methyl ester carboxylesterase
VERSGDPDGSTVLFFHGTPSSRLFVPPADVSRQEHARVVTFDRPGYGLSDPVTSGARIADVAYDLVSALAEQAPVSIVGFSGGAPYALAAGAVCPDLVAAVAVVSGDAPPDVAALPNEEREFVELARSDPSAGRELIAQHAQAFADDPLVYLARTVAGPDCAVRSRPEVHGLLERAVREAGRQGSAGLVTDWLLEILPWGFTPAEVECPVAIWFGAGDPGPAPGAATRLARELPSSAVHRAENAGHELVLTHWREILGGLLCCLSSDRSGKRRSGDPIEERGNDGNEDR